MERNYTPIDRLIAAIDEGLRVSTGEAPAPFRANPAGDLAPAELNEQDREHVAGLMRINHTGEVCAQALYAGQAATARNEATREAMQSAADEEIDHLAWCEERLQELDARPSLLNPLWYAGSFAIGALAGIAGDDWSLGFVKETENQVEAHLADHLDRLPEGDPRREEFQTASDALFGGLSPFCSCGVIPAAIGLRRQGAGRGPSAAFLVSTPESGVDSIAITWALLDPVMTVVRPIAAFITGTLAGILIGLLPEEKTELDREADACDCADTCCG